MPDNSEIYAELAEPFDITFTDTRGGVELTYITGEQIVSRLNEVLGPGGWSFRIRLHDFNTEADEYWVLGELTAIIDGVTVVREQFGSQKCRRSRSTGAPLDIGFDLKGAATDSMKKCASLLGIGLYLSRKKAQPQRGKPVQNGQQRPQQAGKPPTPEGPTRLEEAQAEWHKALDAAKLVGIAPSNVPDSATAGQLEHWTGLLQQRIRDHESSSNGQSAA